jgi:ABC-2 type transport system permease protein
MNPRIILANLIINIKSFYREKSTLFFTIAFPIMLIVLFGYIFQGQENASFDLHVQDRDQTNASAMLIKSLELNGTFKITKIDPEIDAKEYARQNKVNLILIIPEGYQNALINRTMMHNPNQTFELKFIYDPSSSSANTKIQILLSALSSINQAISESRPFIIASSESFLIQKYKYIDFFAPGIIAMSVMTSSLFGAVTMNAELRQKGVLRKLSTTPITRGDWILSNMLYQMFIATISTIFILIVSILLFDLNVHFNVWLPLFVVLDVFAFAGVGMLLTRFAKEAESAYAAANVVMFPVMFLSGTFFPLEIMPDALKLIAKVMPLYYINEGLRYGMIYEDTVQAWPYAVAIGVFALIVFILGIMITGWKEEE